jgi:hypothetical protein
MSGGVDRGWYFFVWRMVTSHHLLCRASTKRHRCPALELDICVDARRVMQNLDSSN